MIADYEGRLVHVGQWCQFAPSLYGEPTLSGTPSTLSTIVCYGYQQIDNHLLQPGVAAETLSWNALVPLVRVDIQEGDFLRNVVDETGVLVLAQARVKEVQVFRSRFEGVRCINLVLERQ